MDNGSQGVAEPTPQATPSKADKITTDHPHRIVITFADDHSIGGAAFDIYGVTPEQMAVAIYHLTRAANMESDRVQIAAMQNQREIQSIMGKLAKGGRG